MKTKKESIEKIVLGVLTFILMVYIIFNLMFLSIFNVSEKFLNKDNVLEFINKIDVGNLIRYELGNEVEEFLSIENELKDVGITTAGINEFVNSTDVKNFSTDVLSNVFEKLINKSADNYYIQNIEVTNLIENNIDKLQINSSLTEAQILKKLSDKIPNLVTNINGLIDKLCKKLEDSEIFTKYQKYVNASIDVLDVIYSDITYCLIVFIPISFILLLIFIRRNIYKSLKWLSISFITPGLVMYILSYILISKFTINNMLIKNIIDIISTNLNTYSFIYISVGIVFIIINIIMYFIKKHKNKNV